MISYADHPEAFTHKAVLVEHVGMSAWIDVRIAKLIKTLWETGLRTIHSCEEPSPALAFISFQSTHAERFCRRLIGVNVDWGIFERLELDKNRKSFFEGFERGYFPFMVPVWSKSGRDDIMFPLAYLPQFEEIAAKPELEKQGPKTIFGCIIT